MLRSLKQYIFLCLGISLMVGCNNKIAIPIIPHEFDNVDTIGLLKLKHLSILPRNGNYNSFIINYYISKELCCDFYIQYNSDKKEYVFLQIASTKDKFCTLKEINHSHVNSYLNTIFLYLKENNVSKVSYVSDDEFEIFYDKTGGFRVLFENDDEILIEKITK